MTNNTRLSFSPANYSELIVIKARIGRKANLFRLVAKTEMRELSWL